MTRTKSPILNLNLLCLSVLLPLSLVIPANARLLHPLSIIHEVGDVCNDLERCVEGTFCDPDGLCSCPEPGSQVFDTYRKKCVAQVFENCESSEDCTQFASCIPQWNQTLARFFGKCQCTGKYFKLPFESICGPRSKFGEPCNEHVNDINFQPCDLSQNLRCRGGQRNGIPYGSCLCENNATYVFDDYRRACVVRAGYLCFSQRSNHPASICVHGAKCQHFQKRLEKKGEMPSSSSSSSSSSRNKALLKSKFTKEFLPHSQPSGSGSLRCRCEAGFSKTAQGFCKPSFGGRCDHQRNECLEGTGLVCSNGECQCESPLYQIFDERVGTCLCKIGAACHHHHHRHNISSHYQQPFHSCVRHAHCHADVSEENSSTTTTTASVLLEEESLASTSTSLGECKCNQGFTKTLDGQCKLDYGSNCSLLNSNSNLLFGPNFEFVGDHGSGSGSGLRWGVQAECNNDVGLACQNGKCVCFDSKLVFDEEARICVNRRADEFCGIFRDEMSGSDYHVGCMKSNHVN